MRPYPMNLLFLYPDNLEAKTTFNIRKDRDNIRVRLCVRLFFQNVPNPVKIGKSVKWKDHLKTDSYLF
jgi:hypothetical protein